MCGIFGVIRYNSLPIDETILKEMAASIQYRGPDHTGFHVEPNAVLGNNRLSIIDISGGNQPIYNETGNLVIVFNGEIYNHRALREQLKSKGHSFRTNSDTEVIIHAYETYGADCVHHLDGMFTFAIWDTDKKKLFLARDPLGIKPLYVLEEKGTFAFASEPKALLPVSNGVRPDFTAINRLLSFGYFPGDDSGFLGIRKFLAGNFGFLEKGQFQQTCYWRPSYNAASPTTFSSAAQQLLALTDKVVAKEMESDVPVGVFLSGGLDSSLIALSANKLAGGNIPSFSLGFEEGTHDETADAKMIADHLGLRHYSHRVTQEELVSSFERVFMHLDAPFGDSTALPLMIISELARKHVKVVLTGWGGDELFAGYPTYKAHQLACLYRRLPKFVRDGLIPKIVNQLPVSDRYMSFEFKAKKFIRGTNLAPELQHFVWMEYLSEQYKKSLFKQEIRDQIHEDTFSPIVNMIPNLSEKSLVDRIQHLDAVTFLEGNGLFQADRMSMSASLEARVPLLNREMVEFASSLPVAVKMKGGALKAVIREALRPHLPPKILQMPKKGFGPPTSNWLCGMFRETAEKYLSEERIEAAGVFEHSLVRRLLDEHLAKKKDHGRPLWLLLSFQLWYEKYFMH